MRKARLLVLSQRRLQLCLQRCSVLGGEEFACGVECDRRGTVREGAMHVLAQAIDMYCCGGVVAMRL